MQADDIPHTPHVGQHLPGVSEEEDLYALAPLFAALRRGVHDCHRHHQVCEDGSTEVHSL